MHQDVPAMLPAIAGFEQIKRYWDPVKQSWTAKILPGEFYVTKNDELITTVLGSCISVCIRDTRLGIGGMNHFMLPEQGEHNSVDWGQSAASAATRYGNWAMEYLINEIIKQGGQKKNFEVKIFGGGQVLANLTDIGQRNILFAYHYLNTENLHPVSADVGDVYSRKLIYSPQSGKVLLKRLASSSRQTIISREKSYSDTLKNNSNDSNVELFD